MHLVVGHLLRAAPVRLVHRPLHRAGDPLGIEDGLAVDVARRAANGLDQRSLGAQEALLVGVQDRDQRHFRQVQALAQQVDADQHVEAAEPQVADDLDALDRVHISVQVADLDAVLVQVFGEVFCHALGERGHQHALLGRDPQVDLREQILDLRTHRAYLDLRVDQPGGTHHLLDHLPGPAKLEWRWRGRDVDGLRLDPLELVEAQRPVVQRGRQAEAVLDQRFLA